MSAKGHVLLQVIPGTDIFHRICKRNGRYNECIERPRQLTSWSSCWIGLCIMCFYVSASSMDNSVLHILIFSTSYIFKCFRNRRTLHTDLTCDVYWTNCVCGSWFFFTGRLVLEWRRYNGRCDTVSMVLSAVLCLCGFHLCTTSWRSVYSRHDYRHWWSVQWYLGSCLLAINTEDSCQCSVYKLKTVLMFFTGIPFS
jgi:hypothetical protein